MNTPSRKYLIVFLSLSILIAFLLVIVEISARKLQTPYEVKYNLVKSSNYDTIILGSSHAFFGINPDYFSRSAVNAANVSQDFKYDLHILNLALKYNKKVNHVILPISIFSLHSDLENGPENYRKYNYSLYMHYHDSSGLASFDLRNYSVFLASPSPEGTLYRVLKSFIHPIKNNWTESGFGTDYHDSASKDLLLSTGKTAALRHQQSNIQSKISVESFDEIVRICQERSIKLLLITPPAYYSYRQNIDKYRTNDIYSKAARALNKDVIYVNYFEDSRFEPEDFHDADHLSHRGAEKLSRLIDEKINNWD